MVHSQSHFRLRTFEEHLPLQHCGGLEVILDSTPPLHGASLQLLDVAWLPDLGGLEGQILEVQAAVLVYEERAASQTPLEVDCSAGSVQSHQNPVLDLLEPLESLVQTAANLAHP